MIEAVRWQKKNNGKATKGNTEANHHTGYYAKGRKESGLHFSILLKFLQDTPQTGDTSYLLIYRYIDWKNINSIKIVAIFRSKLAME